MAENKIVEEIMQLINRNADEIDRIVEKIKSLCPKYGLTYSSYINFTTDVMIIIKGAKHYSKEYDELVDRFNRLLDNIRADGYYCQMPSTAFDNQICTHISL